MTCIITCQPSSTNKDDRKLSKPCSGCCLCILEHGLFMVREKFKQALILLGTYKKLFAIQNPKLLNSVPVVHLLKLMSATFSYSTNINPLKNNER